MSRKIKCNVKYVDESGNPQELLDVVMINANVNFATFKGEDIWKSINNRAINCVDSWYEND